MASLATGGPSTGGGNEFDDLDDYGFDDTNDPNDPFSSAYVGPKTIKEKEVESKKKDSAGLGIDEEVEVSKKPRVPRVKLDENRYGRWLVL